MLLMIATILSVLMLLVVYFDSTKFIIPNWLNAVVLGLFPIFLLATPISVDLLGAVGMFGIFFAIGMLIFSLNVMGGGDVKLFIAIAPWLGWHPEIVFKFLILVAISGGILALFLLAARLILISLNSKLKQPLELPRLFKMKEPLPYGLAIAYAFVYMIWTNNIYGLIIS